MISAEVVDAMTAAIGARLSVFVVSGVSITTACLDPSVINYNVNISVALFNILIQTVKLKLKLGISFWACYEACEVVAMTSYIRQWSISL